MQDAETVHIYKCTRETALEVWPIVEGWLLKSLEVAPPWWRIEDLYELTRKGDYVLALITIDKKPCGVALSRLTKYPSALVCEVPWIGGSGMKLWLPELQKIIEQWAKESGAKYLSGSGRRGWTRAAGMSECGINLVKEL